MSRGHGRVELLILDMAEACERAFTTERFAAYAFSVPIDQLTPSQISSTQRAVAALRRKGKLEIVSRTNGIGNHFRDGWVNRYAATRHGLRARAEQARAAEEAALASVLAGYR